MKSINSLMAGYIPNNSDFDLGFGWLVQVFSIAFQAPEDSPLRLARFWWDETGKCLFQPGIPQVVNEQRMIVPADSVRWFAIIPNVVSASLIAIDILLHQATNEASRFAKRDPHEEANGDAAQRTKNAPPLDNEERAILLELFRCKPNLRSLTDLETAGICSRKTAGEKVSNLITAGLVCRPKGARKGAGLTGDGLKMAEVLMSSEITTRN